MPGVGGEQKIGVEVFPPDLRGDVLDSVTAVLQGRAGPGVCRFADMPRPDSRAGDLDFLRHTGPPQVLGEDDGGHR